MKYNKLVRDNIPEIIAQNGKKARIHIADEREFIEKLEEKLSEEVREFLFANSEEELADIFTVIDAIVEYRGFDRQKIESLKNKKAQERGVFTKRIILDEVTSS